MSFYHLPNPYNPGYALPDYVKAEPPGRGTFTTAWLPRGFISDVVPDFLAQPEGPLAKHTLAKPSLAKPSLKGHSLSGSSLGGSSLGNSTPDEGAAIFVNYGQSTAKKILKILDAVPVKDRPGVLRQALDKIDPGLWPQVAGATSSRAALQRSLASALASGVVGEIIRLGKGDKPKTGQIKNASKKPSSLGGVFSSISGAVSGIVGAVSSATCTLAQSPATGVAAGVYSGQPQTGMAGASVASQLCSTGQQGGMMPYYPYQQQTSWLPYLLLGGGALALILVLK